MLLDPKRLLDLDIVGVPYKKDGRTIEEGFDCYGFVRWAVAHRGVELPGDSTEMISIMKHRRMGKLLRWPCELKPWDVLLTSRSRDVDDDLDKFIIHCSLVIDAENILHANSKSAGVVYQRLEGCISQIKRVIRFNLDK